MIILLEILAKDTKPKIQNKQLIGYNNKKNTLKKKINGEKNPDMISNVLFNIENPSFSNILDE